ncbi:sulfatase-like hydrolase/transferase [Actinorugispora endophytica]|uniref:Sulfatase-like protein n=1 Tax=Actinorugispora endophytica TaxID=1605990 RepID=A0A4R6V319_9ACTN|nr:sulfatase-like hydrolase/transferase [Actinorugispora endophytica]TDQ54440.1 sulfatase-like protein [Actinorugispora endophytica]
MQGVDLVDRDVLLITLDSCRYDVAADANTPHLSRLGPLLRAESPGTYTLPAHAALFNGFLPRPASGRFLLSGKPVEMIWRSAAARPTGGSVAVTFTGPTLMEHYVERGHRVIGAGGVTFFDPADTANSLPKPFPEFHYFGRSSRALSNLDSRVADRADTLPLTHVETLADRCADADHFFLFVNCSSTHIPYTTPNSPLTEQTSDALRRLYRLHDTKVPWPAGPPPLSRDDVRHLLDMQRRALEWADHQLGRLFARLATRRPLVVVCADHGEEFGESGRYGHGHPHSSVSTVPLWCGLLDPEEYSG